MLTNAVLLVVGVSQLFLLVDYAFIWDFSIGRLFRGVPVALRRDAVVWEIWVITGVLFLSSLWSPDIVTGAMTALRVLLVSVWLGRLSNSDMSKLRGFISLPLLVIVTLSAVEVLGGNNRAALIFNNPYLLGLLGLSVMPLWSAGVYGAAIVGLSGTRTAIIIFTFWYALNFKRFGFYKAVLLVCVSVGVMAVINVDRISVSGLVDSAEKRGAINSDNVEPLDQYTSGKCGAVVERDVSLLGYGFRGYCASTGQPRPHNIYLVSVFELGVFSLPFWIAVIGLFRRVSWRVYAPLLLLGFASDDLFSRPEGVYIIVLWLLSNNVIFRGVRNGR